MNDSMTADEIRELRKAYGETRYEFAKRAKVTPSAVYFWERGIYRPDARNMARLLALARRAPA